MTGQRLIHISYLLYVHYTLPVTHIKGKEIRLLLCGWIKGTRTSCGVRIVCGCSNVKARLVVNLEDVAALVTEVRQFSRETDRLGGETAT